MNSDSVQLLINRYLRSIRFPGFIGGRIAGGYNSSLKQDGLGDCALFDFANGVFAVSDGSDRDPSASRRFMIAFSRMMDHVAHQPAGSLHGDADISLIKEALTAQSEKLLCSLPFRSGCTFTGVLLLKTAGGVTAVVMHSGDSLLIACDLRESLFRQVTTDNFWLVGRSQRFFQIEVLPLRGCTRLLLATDGIRGIPAPAGLDRDNFILDLFKGRGPEEIPDIILDSAGPPSPGKDDATIIAIDPAALDYLPQRLILGGTGSHEEKLYREERDRGLIDNSYSPVSSSETVLTI